jgi:hypothetical protein
MRLLAFAMLLVGSGIVSAQQAVAPVPQVAEVRALEPPAAALPAESASAGVT